MVFEDSIDTEIPEWAKIWVAEMMQLQARVDNGSATLPNHELKEFGIIPVNFRFPRTLLELGTLKEEECNSYLMANSIHFISEEAAAEARFKYLEVADKSNIPPPVPATSLMDKIFLICDFIGVRTGAILVPGVVEYDVRVI